MENRPKRRKHKDNPYELNIIDSKYIVKFKDNNITKIAAKRF